MFSMKATKIDEIFTINLTICSTLYGADTYTVIWTPRLFDSKCRIDGEDFVNFCGLLRKQELYINKGHLALIF